MKRLSLGIFIMSLVLAITCPAFASSLLFDRGLPTTNLNNAAGPNRSNVCWADGWYSAPQQNYQASGDDFSIGTSGAYHLDKIRVWTVDSPIDVTTGYRLLGGPEFGVISLKSTSYSVSTVHYDGGADYEANAGTFYPLYQVDFNVDWTITGGQKNQFFIDSPMFNFGTEEAPSYATSFLHASNKDFSGSTQQGADNIFLLLNMTGGYPGTPGSVTYWDGTGGGLISDGNVQVYGTPLPGSILLLGSGLVGLGFLGRRKIKRS